MPAEPQHELPLAQPHRLRRERPRPFLDQRAEGAVALIPPGAPGDLRHFSDAQAALAMTASTDAAATIRCWVGMATTPFMAVTVQMF